METSFCGIGGRAMLELINHSNEANRRHAFTMLMIFLIYLVNGVRSINFRRYGTSKQPRYALCF